MPFHGRHRYRAKPRSGHHLFLGSEVVKLRTIALLFGSTIMLAACADRTITSVDETLRPPSASRSVVASTTTISSRTMQSLNGGTMFIGASVYLVPRARTTRRTTTAFRFSSSNTQIATIDPTTGLLYGRSRGRTTIVATTNVSRESIVLDVENGVTFSVTPTSASILVGQTVALSAETSSSLAWSSSDTTVVSVDGTGLARAKAVGSAQVTAVKQDGSRGIASITVSAGTTSSGTPVVVTPGTASITAGQSVQLSASGGRGVLRWVSADSTIARVSSVGLVTAIRTGVVAITARDSSNSGASAQITVSAVVNNPPPPPLPSTVELPRVFLDSLVTSARGASAARTINVSTGAALQTAIDTSRFGDHIVLQPGVTYVGPFTLKTKTGNGWITIRSGSTSLPIAGVRVRPSDAAKLPKLIAASSASPVIQTQAGAYNYRLVGIEISTAATASTAGTLVALGTTTQTSLAQMPRNLVFDRVYVHGTTTLSFQRCIALNSGATAIVDSWISDCHGKGFDSQAIGGWNGSGPYKIVNNYLEGAGENVMFGGSDPQISGVVPSDIEFRHNHVFKPASWQGVWSVKNNLELKLGIRVLIEGNIFENNWVDAQSGFSVLFKSVNQAGGAPWSETRDVTFRYNIIRNVPHAINLAAKPEPYTAVPMTKVLIAHNTFEHIGSGSYAGGRLWQSADVSDLTFANNTGFGLTQGLILLGTNVASRLAVENNVFGTSQQYFGSWDFALSGDNAGRGTSALTKFYGTSWTFQRNVIPGYTASTFPANNVWVALPSQIGFVSFPSDLSLSGSSPFRTAGTNSTLPGADFPTLRQQTAGVVVLP